MYTCYVCYIALLFPQNRKTDSKNLFVKRFCYLGILIFKTEKNVVFFWMSVASWCSTCFCVVLSVFFVYGRFCHGVLKLDMSIYCLQHSFFRHLFNLYLEILLYFNNTVLHIASIRLKRLYMMFHLPAVCNGECGSKHPHSAIYDEATSTFEITGDK